jgi:hypothetical protein
MFRPHVPREQQMTDPKNVVESVLRDMEVKYEPSETGFVFFFEDSDGPEVDGYAHVLAERKEFVVFLEFRKTTPKKYRMEMCVFVTRANWGISIGNFELDFDTGYVRYKTSIDYGTAALPKEFVRRAIADAMDGVAEFGPGVVGVMSGKMTADQAVEATDQGASD